MHDRTARADGRPHPRPSQKRHTDRARPGPIVVASSAKLTSPTGRQAGLTCVHRACILPLESELDTSTEIQNRVKELRTARGWTQQELADAVGVSRQSINSIERERYVPSLMLALTFAKVFGLTTDEIFTLETKK